MVKAIWTGTLSSVVGGILLALLFFGWNDFIYQRNNLTGAWEFEYTVEHTTHDPFQDMKLRYRVLLVQEGKTITGTGEKIGEWTPAHGVVEYLPEKRAHIRVEGTVDYRFFSKDVVHLQYTEEGRVRESSTIQELSVISERDLRGDVYSTAANAQGTAAWERKQPSS